MMSTCYGYIIHPSFLNQRDPFFGIKINRIEKIQLWIHTSICGLCKEFDGQNDFINHHLEIHFHNKQDKGIGLCNEDKKSMKKALLESE